MASLKKTENTNSDTTYMKYTEKNRLGDIISEHYQLLFLMSRFGISLGFGDKTVKEVCEEKCVNCDTFLSVINFVTNGDTNISNVSASAMVSFLRLSHDYYLNFFFPQLRTKLIEAVNGVDTKLVKLIIAFFDSYVKGVAKHLLFEDQVVFTYVENLCQGKIIDETFHLTQYTRKHEQIDGMLLELKNIIIKYIPDNGKANELNAVLFDIYSCEADLKSHCEIEDNIFVPVVTALEAQVKASKEAKRNEAL